MKEKEFIKIIKTTLKSDYIGDDCAYLKDLGIVMTQDSLVEGVHFSRHFATPYQLGFKSVAVNISDICASGAEPKYLTIALSLPHITDTDFIKEFYIGAKKASNGAKIVGGDITGADKIFISVTAIGSTKNRKISARSHARVGQKIVIAGEHGSSALGLNLLKGMYYPRLSEDERFYFTNSHLMPKVQIGFSEQIAKTQKTDYAMTDTSDGLADALFNIAEASKVMLDVDFDKIPYAESLKKITDYEDLILFGGEDYGLIATVDDPQDLTVIGEVKEGNGVKINYPGFSQFFEKNDIERNLYNHFKE